MKKFKLILALAMTAMVMPCPAQSNMGILQSPNKKVTATMTKSNDTKFTAISKDYLVTTHKNAVSPTEEGMVTLSFKMNANTDNFPSSSNSLVIYSSTSNQNYYADTWAGNAQIPPGTYDFVASFGGMDTVSIVFKEQIVVNNDTTIEFNESDSKLVDIKAYHPNGDPFTIDKYAVDENWNYVLVEKGNVNNLTTFDDFVRKADMTDVFRLMTMNGKIIKIGGMSDRFFFVDRRAYYNEGTTDDCLFVNLFYIDGEDKLLENNPNNYKYTVEEFVSSKVGENRDKWIMGALMEPTYNGYKIQDGTITIENRSETPAKIWLNIPQSTPGKTNHFNLLVCPMVGDNQLRTIYNYDDGMGNIVFSDTVYTWKHLYGPAILAENDEINYINNGNTNPDMYFFMSTLQDGNVRSTIYPGHPKFSFTASQKGGKFGDNTPINLFCQGPIIPIVCSYLGRYGELRESDNDLLTMTLKLNGEPVDCTYADRNQYFYEWTIADRVKGTVDFEFDNQNMVVDGLQGRNLSKIHYDETADDSFAPTMTMLQMRDVNGNVTDRFEKADDGIIMFSCGDFKFCGNLNTFQYWYECSRPQVEAYYAVNGQDDWTILSITEDEDAYRAAGFGHLFNADLNQIDGEGWFDLKFKVSDAAGNYQEQIVSPAFKIGDTQTGIGNVKVGNATEVARYTVDGRAISAPQAGVNIVKMSDGSVKKVWVK
ncbi:MAG: hypothetical protein KBT10_06005 [Bacteroidales bacterium]|nr:hypothetical protein [Candidatus Sodaliphilus aphodohippi]